MSRLGKSIRQRLKDSQSFQQYKILGKYYNRYKFGEEPWHDPEEESCIQCKTKKTQLHALGCSEEYIIAEACKCNAFGKRAIYCTCEAQENEPQ